ncbi:hypothetical protein HER14_09950 [Acidithiobacillus thiooxidans]|uniref:hypothetical protein n=1 Tax=Acidithiobacillus thiooxidans TaxID=930 RepID=UPI001C07BFFC|nr:hypothetical protein [Acidithiobacillus thiooxidans]MBU2751249.1 hypothetical protein [Acidithiobacillus thiooxidans]
MPIPHFKHVAKLEKHPYLSKVLMNPDMGGIGGPCTLLGLSTLDQERKCRVGEILETSGPATLFAESADFGIQHIPFPPNGNMRPEFDYLTTGRIHHESIGRILVKGLKIIKGTNLINNKKPVDSSAENLFIGALSFLNGPKSNKDSGKYPIGYLFWVSRHLVYAVHNYPDHRAAQTAMVKNILWAERISSTPLMEKVGSKMIGDNSFWAPGKVFFSVSSSIYGVYFHGKIDTPLIYTRQKIIPLFIWTENIKPISTNNLYPMTIAWQPIGQHRLNTKWDESECLKLSERFSNWTFITRVSKDTAFLCDSGKCIVRNRLESPVL